MESRNLPPDSKSHTQLLTIPHSKSFRPDMMWFFYHCRNSLPAAGSASMSSHFKRLLLILAVASRARLEPPFRRRRVINDGRGG